MPANAVRGGADSETPYRRPDRSCRSCAGSGARAAGQGHRAGLPALPLAGWLAASGDAATDPARPRTAERELDGGGRAYGAGGGSRRYAGTRLADSRQRRYAGCGLRGLFPVRGRGRTGATAGALSRRAQAARAASQAVPRAGVDVRAASRAAGVEAPGVAAAARSSPRSGEPMMEAPEAVSMQSEASPPPPRLTSLSHGGGCGCKIAPGLLSEILRTTVRMPVPPELLVGIETADDAAVYRLNDEQALVATTDFFMPIVDDPFDFGRIAATNAISDVYAMGGRPILALALVGMPVNVLPVQTIRRNTPGPDLAAIDGVGALSDVTGFGLAGHLLEIAGGSGARIRIDWPRVPILPGARELAAAGCVTGASGRNWAGYGRQVRLSSGFPEVERALLTDPQTSGGLLVTCAPRALESVLAVFRRHGFGAAAEIGEVCAADGGPLLEVLGS